jgi:hypothetical protein
MAELLLDRLAEWRLEDQMVLGRGMTRLRQGWNPNGVFAMALW